MITEAYADIHHFEADNKAGLVDDDGDTLMGWYFQLMESPQKAITEIFGPYGSRDECELAAGTEWSELA